MEDETGRSSITLGGIEEYMQKFWWETWRLETTSKNRDACFH